MNDSDKSIDLTLGARFLKLNQVDPAGLGALASLVGTLSMAK